MVEKKVPRIARDHITKLAKSVKVVEEHVTRHTRTCYELNTSKNCKFTSEKKLTRDQQKAYNQILKDQRDKNERYIKKTKNKKKNAKKSKMIVVGQINSKK